MYCSYCGQDNQDVVSFCHSCGEAIKHQERKCNKSRDEKIPRDNWNGKISNLCSDDFNNEKYKGVSGWLLIYCLTLLIIQPITVIGNIVVSDIESLYAYYPKLHTTVIIENFLSIAILLFGIYSAIGLIKIRKNAIAIIGKFLITTLIHRVVSIFLVYIAGLIDETMIDEVVIDIGQGLIYFTVWHLYFKKSRRVKATYSSGF